MEIVRGQAPRLNREGTLPLATAKARIGLFIPAMLCNAWDSTGYSTWPIPSSCFRILTMLPLFRLREGKPQSGHSTPSTREHFSEAPVHKRCELTLHGDEPPLPVAPAHAGPSGSSDPDGPHVLPGAFGGDSRPGIGTLLCRRGGM